MTQLGIFDPPVIVRKPRVKPFTASEASRQADESVATSKEAQKQKIVRYIASRPDGATCDDCEQALGMRHQTCSARFFDLKSEGVIVSTGESRRTRSGCKAVVYRVTA